jgi:hypothetical protein
MPVGAEVCTFQWQNGVPCLWAIVDSEATKEVRKFAIFGTGYALPKEDACCYVGTTQDGPYVWHLFELL